MDMQDREMDDLFRSKLEGFEAEPTEKVWTGIGSGLDNDKRRRIFIPLQIAAGVIILLTAGLILVMHKENIKPVKHAQNQLVHNPAPAIKPTIITSLKQPEQVKMAKYPVVTEKIARTTVLKKANTTVATNTAPVIKETPEPAQPIVPQQEVIANVTTPVETNKATEPGVKDQEVIKDEPVTIAPVQTKPQLIAQTPAQQPASKPAKRHGIHNMGDLVNLVVAKVDKRKEKLIQFSDTDDDESNLTAVNIGPIKLNREDKSEK